MIQFLLILFLVFVLMIFSLGFSVVRLILRFLFGSRTTSPNSSSRRESHNQQQRGTSDNNNTRKNTSKVFQKDEGEYVDFEEIKN